MAVPVSPSSPGPPEDRRRSWWLPVGTFLAGCALGAVVVGLVGLGDDAAPPPASAAAERAADGPADQPAEAGDVDAGLYVRVPDSCVRTADDATTLVEHVDRVVAAVADLEPERLRQAVDEVQQVRDRVEGLAEQCRADAAERLEDAAAPSTDAAPVTPAS